MFCAFGAAGRWWTNYDQKDETGVPTFQFMQPAKRSATRIKIKILSILGFSAVHTHSLSAFLAFALSVLLGTDLAAAGAPPASKRFTFSSVADDSSRRSEDSRCAYDCCWWGLSTTGVFTAGGKPGTKLRFIARRLQPNIMPVTFQRFYRK
jgi:hypothetical protein